MSEETKTPKQAEPIRPAPLVQVERLVSISRRRLMLTEDRATDEQIIEITKGTIMLVSARMEIAGQDLSAAFAMVGEPAILALKRAVNRMNKFKC